MGMGLIPALDTHAPSSPFVAAPSTVKASINVKSAMLMSVEGAFASAVRNSARSEKQKQQRSSREGDTDTDMIVERMLRGC
jgi:hypothetical protein